jgi:hypothetical protein
MAWLNFPGAEHHETHSMRAGGGWKTFLARVSEPDGQVLPNMLLILAKHWLTEQKSVSDRVPIFPRTATLTTPLRWLFIWPTDRPARVGRSVFVCRVPASAN